MIYSASCNVYNSALKLQNAISRTYAFLWIYNPTPFIRPYNLGTNTPTEFKPANLQIPFINQVLVSLLKKNTIKYTVVLILIFTFIQSQLHADATKMSSADELLVLVRIFLYHALNLCGLHTTFLESDKYF